MLTIAFILRNYTQGSGLGLGVLYSLVIYNLAHYSLPLLVKTSGPIWFILYSFKIYYSVLSFSSAIH